MNTISKQEKSFNKNKNTIKKLSKFITSRMFYLLLGLFLTMAIFTVQAAWNSKVNTGQVFTTTLWNDMVDKLVDLNGRTGTLENEISYSNCYWHTTTVYHVNDAAWDTVTCPSNCIVRGLRTTETPAYMEQHQIYCCCY